MKLPRTSLIRCLTIGILLLSGCTKDSEQPTPRTSQAGESINSLKQAFLAKGYDKQLIVPSKNQAKAYWTPRWNQFSQRTDSDSVKYVWVP
ncbi:MAG TPA: hypothetical protein VF690_17865, partial [Hymenobacter sp.]